MAAFASDTFASGRREASIDQWMADLRMRTNVTLTPR